MTSGPAKAQDGWERLASGAWIDRPLVRAASLMSIAASLAALGYLWFTRSGLLDAWGRPLGTDFSNAWVAGRTVLAGGAVPYDFALHHEAEKAVFGPGTPLYGWHYPPIFLLIAVPLAHLPYLWALLCWQAASLVPALMVVRRILPDRDVMLASLGFPAVVVCLMHGHNGFLSAFLFGAALLVLPTRPILAGMLFGCLAYKPQFGMLLPLALWAAGQWRAIASAGATVLALVALSAWLFGLDGWLQFPAALAETSRVILEEGAASWPTLQSAFAAVRRWGGSATIAYAVQAPVSLAAAIAVLLVWRSEAAHEIKAAALIAGSLLVTPYVIDYDLTVLGPAIAFLAAHGRREGFGRWTASALALAWFAPLAGRPALDLLGLPLGFLALVLLLCLTTRDALAARAETATVPA